VNVHALLAVGVNADGYREILGLHLTSAEDGAGWLGFLRDLVARGLSGVALVTSDAHRGLVESIGATLPGVSWQRCRTHYAANLMATTPKSAWGWVEDHQRESHRPGGDHHRHHRIRSNQDHAETGSNTTPADVTQQRPPTCGSRVRSDRS
jgi:hypothetical protein